MIHSRKTENNSAKELDQIFHMSHDLICIADIRNGAFIKINKAFSKTLGFSEKKILSQKVYDFIHPEDIEPTRIAVQKELETGKSTINFENRYICKNGDCRWISWVTHPEPEKGVTYAVGRDITELKQSEEQRLKLLSHIEHTKKFETINTLAAGVAHQFNNALSIITGNTELLVDDFTGNLGIESYADKIQSAADRMKRLTSQLLAYAGGGRYNISIILVQDFINEMISILQYQMGQGITIATTVQDKHLHIEVDRSQMQMLLSAVLLNASESMEGQGTIRIETRESVFDQESKEKPRDLSPGEYACITITDYGTGMNKETQKRIFEPFFTHKFHGRGLGMAAAFGIAKSHKGSVAVKSEPGRGTAVSIYLPLVRNPKPHGAKQYSSTAPIDRKQTILLIEDEEDVISVYRAIIERMGIEVMEARSGKEALSQARNHDEKIDLALLDIMMPDMYGNEIFPELKKIRPGIKVIVSSGYSIHGPVQEVMDKGAEDFIQKPFSASELTEKIKKHIQ